MQGHDSSGGWGQRSSGLELQGAYFPLAMHWDWPLTPAWRLQGAALWGGLGNECQCTWGHCWLLVQGRMAGAYPGQIAPLLGQGWPRKVLLAFQYMGPALGESTKVGQVAGKGTIILLSL